MPKAKPMEAAPMRIDEMIDDYIKLRSEIERVEEIQRRKLQPSKDTLERLGGVLMKHLDDTGQEMARTQFGTIFTTTTHTASLKAPGADVEAFMNYVMQNGAFELMDRRANATACLDFAEEHGALPPGVKINSHRKLGVRKS